MDLGIVPEVGVNIGTLKKKLWVLLIMMGEVEGKDW